MGPAVPATEPSLAASSLKRIQIIPFQGNDSIWIKASPLTPTSVSAGGDQENIVLGDGLDPVIAHGEGVYAVGRAEGKGLDVRASRSRALGPGSTGASIQDRLTRPRSISTRRGGVPGDDRWSKRPRHAVAEIKPRLGWLVVAHVLVGHAQAIDGVVHQGGHPMTCRDRGRVDS